MNKKLICLLFVISAIYALACTQITNYKCKVW